MEEFIVCVCVFSQRYDWFMIPRWRPSYILKFSSSSPHLLERERERNILFLVWFDNNYTTVLKNNLLFYFIIWLLQLKDDWNPRCLLKKKSARYYEHFKRCQLIKVQGY